MKEMQKEVSFKLRRRNLFKSEKMLKISQTCCTAQPLFKLILHAKATAFAACFWGHFNPPGFTNRSKSLNQLRSNNLHYHCCFLSPKSCFKSVICRQNLLVKCSDLHVFAMVVGKKYCLGSPRREHFGFSTIWRFSEVATF